MALASLPRVHMSGVMPAERHPTPSELVTRTGLVGGGRGPHESSPDEPQPRSFPSEAGAPASPQEKSDQCIGDRLTGALPQIYPLISPSISILP